MLNKRKKFWLVLIIIVVVLAGVLSLPPVWSRVAFHARAAYAEIKYRIKPPNQAVFVPSTSKEDPISATNTSATVNGGSTQPTQDSIATPTESNPATTSTQTKPADATPLSTPEDASTPTPTLAPTSIPTATPMPSSVYLTGIKGERQAMNNCGPATLSMNLSFYKWGKDQDVIADVLKPNSRDVNVMPYELVDFVNEYTDLRALWRYGGDLQTLKVLLNAGFPVMIEKSFEPYDLRSEGWMGHYNLVVGYDDARQSLTVQDSYLLIKPPWGIEIPEAQLDNFSGFDFYYSALSQAWRSFNYVFIVVYPPDKENEVLKALGPLATEEGANRIAYDFASQETETLTDIRDQFFAWFNAGTSLVAMQDYSSAAAAYDKAFVLYPQIDTAHRPYRILWYEPGPYIAYYYAERYRDVINLADQTLSFMADPALEESYYWRAMANVALGNVNEAVEDLRTSLKYHPGYAPSVALLKQLGKTP